MGVDWRESGADVVSCPVSLPCLHENVAQRSERIRLYMEHMIEQCKINYVR